MEQLVWKRESRNKSGKNDRGRKNNGRDGCTGYRIVSFGPR